MAWRTRWTWTEALLLDTLRYQSSRRGVRITIKLLFLTEDIIFRSFPPQVCLFRLLRTPSPHPSPPFLCAFSRASNTSISTSLSPPLSFPQLLDSCNCQPLLDQNVPLLEACSPATTTTTTTERHQHPHQY